MRGGEVYDVFLSYSRADSAAAEALRARLKEAGLTAFLDRYALPAGQPWQPWLEQHLKFCRALAALVGSEGLGEWQHREIQLGLDRQASAAKAGQAFPVIPVLLPGLASDAIPIGSFLSLNTWVDLRSGLDDPESLQSLISGAQGAAIDAAAAEKLLAGLTPYRGLLPFREQDAGLFFGRKRFVDELVEKVERRTATNVVAVVGRSGSGKSSIVYAGLFPALRCQRGVGDESVWRILDLRPHDEPLNQLALAFDPPKEEPGSMAWVAGRHFALWRGAQALSYLCSKRLPARPGLMAACCDFGLYFLLVFPGVGAPTLLCLISRELRGGPLRCGCPDHRGGRGWLARRNRGRRGGPLAHHRSRLESLAHAQPYGCGGGRLGRRDPGA